jgi:uncharacterized protein involved in exopolysaccharide biosynthesis
MNIDHGETKSVTQEQETPIDLTPYFRILRAEKGKIVLFSLGVGILTLLYMFTKPNTYRATAVIKPDRMESNRGGSSFGALASFGLPFGSPSRVEDLEVLLKSEDLAIRMFRKNDLWPILLPDSYDPVTKAPKKSWLGRLFGGGGKARTFSDWEAVRAVRGRMKVTSERKTGVINISFESRSAEGSATILRTYLDEAKSRLQDEALSRANNNKEFIQGQIAQTIDPLTRERLFGLYGQEVEREMLARNREQFGFTIIDSPKAPDQKAGPQRSRSAMKAAILAFFAGCGYFVFRRKQ